MIKTLATVSLFFVFCWAWNQTYYLMYYVGYPYVDFTSDFYNFTVIMVFLNCCVNPVIYSIRYDQVRQTGLSKLTMFHFMYVKSIRVVCLSSISHIACCFIVRNKLLFNCFVVLSAHLSHNERILIYYFT